MPAPPRRTLHGLAPVIGDGARVLILGSFPGRLSLEAGQYYANPKNQFWEIMENLTGTERGLSYRERIAALVSWRIALWDSIGSCIRVGSADNHIRSPLRNPVGHLLKSYPGIQLIACNGTVSFRFLLDPEQPLAIPVRTMPSTSPANARLSLDGKVRAWSEIMNFL